MLYYDSLVGQIAYHTAMDYVYRLSQTHLLCVAELPLFLLERQHPFLELPVTNSHLSQLYRHIFLNNH